MDNENCTASQPAQPCGLNENDLSLPISLVQNSSLIIFWLFKKNKVEQRVISGVLNFYFSFQRPGLPRQKILISFHSTPCDFQFLISFPSILVSGNCYILILDPSLSFYPACVNEPCLRQISDHYLPEIQRIQYIFLNLFTTSIP